MSVVSEVFDHCCVHFVGFSEGLMLPKNYRAPVMAPDLHVSCFQLQFPSLALEQPLHLGVLQQSSSVACAFTEGLWAGLSECLGWSTGTAQPGTCTGMGDPCHEAIGSDH